MTLYNAIRESLLARVLGRDESLFAADMAASAQRLDKAIRGDVHCRNDWISCVSIFSQSNFHLSALFPCCNARIASAYCSELSFRGASSIDEAGA